jgi:beta-phosphoglucomutase-like phosphatase (HAD superfamily)
MNNIIEQYDLFIFDLDDTIVKTEHIHYQSWLLALEYMLGYKYYIEPNEFYSIFHSNYQNSIKDYLKNTHNIAHEEIIKKKDKIYFDLINKLKNEIKMIDGCENFINKIIENNKKFIIVSNTVKEQIDFFSDLFPILKKSTKNYYRELLKTKKPNPECYLKVLDDFPNMKKLGFEDSITGIHAITRVPEIRAYYINSNKYVHHNFILENYNVLHINNYNDLMW